MEGGAKWTGRARGGHLGWAIFAWLIDHAGLKPAYALLYLVVPYYILFMPAARRAQWDYHRRVRALGWWRATRALCQTFFDFSRTLIDRQAIAAGLQDKFTLQYDDDERPVNQALSDGQPIMIVTAHFGAWDTGLPFFARFGKRLHIALVDNEDQGVKNVRQGGRPDDPYDTLTLGPDMLDNALRLREAMQQGGGLCFMGDRYLPGAPTQTKTFLGQPVDFGTAPWQLAAALRCPIAIYFATRFVSEGKTGYRYHFRLLQPGQRRPDPDELLDAYVQELDKHVREFPTQWFNFYDYFHR